MLRLNASICCEVMQIKFLSIHLNSDDRFKKKIKKNCIKVSSGFQADVWRTKLSSFQCIWVLEVMN